MCGQAEKDGNPFDLDSRCNDTVGISVSLSALDILSFDSTDHINRTRLLWQPESGSLLIPLPVNPRNLMRICFSSWAARGKVWIYGFRWTKRAPKGQLRLTLTEGSTTAPQRRTVCIWLSLLLGWA